MEVLATDPGLESGDLAAFHKRARELLPQLPGYNIFLSDESGQELVNTLRPYGEQLPLTGAEANVRLVFSTGRPVTTDLYRGTVSMKPLVSIIVRYSATAKSNTGLRSPCCRSV